MVTHYQIKGKKFWTRTHNQKCLLNEDNELWNKYGFKKKVYKNFSKKYRGRGLPPVRKLSKEIFEITLDLILKDVVEKNCTFVFPSRDSGKLKMMEGRNYKYNLKTKLAYNHIAIIDFKKNTPGHPYKWIVKLGKKYIRLKNKLVESGHFYPKKQYRNV